MLSPGKQCGVGYLASQRVGTWKFVKNAECRKSTDLNLHFTCRFRCKRYATFRMRDSASTSEPPEKFFTSCILSSIIEWHI